MLTATQLTALRSLVRRPEFGGLGAADVALRITAPTARPNSAPAPATPVPITSVELLDAIDSETAGLLIELPNFQSILDSTSDPRKAALWLMLLAKARKVTQSSAAAIQALLARTQPDPAWPATLSGPSLLESEVGIGSVAVTDVEEAL